MTEDEALARLLPKNHDKPHRAVIMLSAEVHELTPHGDCSGMAVYRIAPFPIFLDGADQAAAVRRLNELFEELKKR